MQYDFDLSKNASLSLAWTAKSAKFIGMLTIH